MTAHYSLVTGVSVQPVGTIWAAFSHASGETLLLNDESAAVLEVLAHASASADDVINALAADSGVGHDEIAESLADCWSHLVQVGLVRQSNGAPDRTRSA